MFRVIRLHSERAVEQYSRPDGASEVTFSPRTLPPVVRFSGTASAERLPAPGV
jgi:hypothetical protein